MSLRRLRLGETLGLLGAAALLVTLFFDWFGAGSGWSHLGWLMDLSLVVAMIGAGWIAWVTVRGAAPVWALGACVVTGVVGAIVFLVLLVRVITLADDDGMSAGVAAYLGLVFMALIPVGAWMAMRDERLTAPESAFTPPPARPVPDG